MIYLKKKGQRGTEVPPPSTESVVHSFQESEMNLYLHWSSAVSETSEIRDKGTGIFALVYATNPLHLIFAK